MDDVIQILVFVVTIIIVIASAIMKQKKKTGAKNINLESLVESFIGGVSQNQNQPLTDVEEKIEQDDSFFDDETDKNKLQIVDDLIKGKYFEKGADAIPDNNEDISINDKIDNEIVEANFDLRQAVIYSEILKRKTF